MPVALNHVRLPGGKADIGLDIPAMVIARADEVIE
jgi:hypothetical protein